MFFHVSREHCTFTVGIISRMEAVTLQKTVTKGRKSCVVTSTSEGETGQGNGGRVPAALMIAEKTTQSVGVIA